MTTIGLVGSGPAAEAVRAGVSDIDAGLVEMELTSITDSDIGIVIGRVGDRGFDRVNRDASEAAIPWVSLEVGGIGGVPIDEIDASIVGFGPKSGCFSCLKSRVAAHEPARAERIRADRAAVRLAGAIAGRELARLVGGASSTIIGNVVEVPYVERRLLPIPGCDVCGDGRDRDGIGALTDRDRSLKSAIAHAEESVDSRVGIVSTVGEVESYPAPYYLARTADTAGFSDATAATEAAGVDEDWDRAFMKALGESLERYAAGIYRAREFHRGTVAAVEDSIPPASFVRHEIPDVDERIPWLSGISLSTGDRVSIPAELVVFPPPERRFGPSITTGLGLGNSIVEAIHSGLTEVIERDATMLAWYSTFEPLRVSVTDDSYNALRRRARGEGLAVTPLLVTQDVDVPVIAVAVHREDEWPRFAIGSSAGTSANEVARSALAEALQNWMELRGIGPDRADTAGAWIGRYAEFPGPVRRLVETETTVSADHLDSDGDRSGKGALDALIERSREAGLEPYAVRLTTPDLRELGFEAVRVVIPQAQPMFTSEPVFGRRAREVPRSLGFESRLDREPHPYP